jgi:hypothetical protein
MKWIKLIVLRSCLLTGVIVLLQDITHSGPLTLDAVLIVMGIIGFAATFIDFSDAPPF